MALFDNGGETAGTGSTLRGSIINQFFGMFDSNIALSAASHSLTQTGANGKHCGIILSIAPAGTLHTTTLTESISNTDTLIRTTTRLFTEAITNTGTLIKTASRAFIEAITNTDVLSKTPGKTLTELSGSTSAGPNSPGTMADDASVGTITWSSPNNAKVSDAVYTEAAAVGSLSAIYNGPNGTGVDLISAQLVILNTPTGSDLGDGANLHTSETYMSYGGATNLWGIRIDSSSASKFYIFRRSVCGRRFQNGHSEFSLSESYKFRV